MAQPNPIDKVTVDQVLKLVDQLSDDERRDLYRKLDLKSWGERWRALCSKVDQQNKHLEPLTEEEIIHEMKEIRKELKAERAQSRTDGKDAGKNPNGLMTTHPNAYHFGVLQDHAAWQRRPSSTIG